MEAAGATAGGVGAARETAGLGRDFAWLWASFAVSTFGTRLAFDAFALIAIIALDAGPLAVSLLAASGLAVGAIVAVPLGPWVEFRHKRRVMVAMDLTRFAAMASVPLTYALGWLSLAQLIVVSVVVAAANIASRAASGALVKRIVAPDGLLAANARLESTTWTATVIGPPVGGAAIGVLGPVVTVVADAASYLLSALGLRAIQHTEAVPERPPADGRGSLRRRAGEVSEGWRFILGDATLRPLFLNTVLVNGLILAGAPLMAVLMLGELGFAPWEYALAFGLPCLGGLLGARLSRVAVARLGPGRVLGVFGALRACWPLGLAFVTPGTEGLLLVIALQFALVTCIGVFNPVLATHRLERTPDDRIARTLAAWTVTSSATVAAVTALWGGLAAVAGTRFALAAAGVALLLTPLLLPRRRPGRPIP